MVSRAGLPKRLRGRIWHRARKYERIDFEGAGVDYIRCGTSQQLLQLESQFSPALNLLQLSCGDGRAMPMHGQGYVCICHPKQWSEGQQSCQVSGEMCE